MADQLPLDFDVRQPVRNGDGEAARDGAATIQSCLRGLRARAFATFVRAGERGATNEDVYRDNPDVREHSIRPRVAELIAAGLLEECGRRSGSYGVAITVWRLTVLGQVIAKARVEREGDQDD